MRRLIIILLGLSLTTQVDARRKRVAQDTSNENESTDIDPEKGPFDIAHEAIELNDIGRAVMAFISVSENESYTPHQGDALFQLGALLEEQNLPYSALLAYNSALEKIDKGAVSTVSKEQVLPKVIALSKVVGDSDIRLEVLSKSKNSELTEEDISHKHYLLARNAARSGNYGGALKNLKMIKRRID